MESGGCMANGVDQLGAEIKRFSYLTKFISPVTTYVSSNYQVCVTGTFQNNIATQKINIAAKTIDIRNNANSCSVIATSLPWGGAKDFFEGG